MKRSLLAVGTGALIALTVSVPSIRAFCGFYVAKADARLFNEASQVVLVRNDDKTVITMVNDFQGDPEEFAVVIPVPTFIEREQIHVTNKALVDHLDAFTAPRLVEYFDRDPCHPYVEEKMALRSALPATADAQGAGRARALGVTIEAQYTVGEYDILILSAEQSDGLETWLKENGYRLPPGASRVLGSYIRQNMRFFVARVNLEEKSALGFSYLRPIQVAYESPKFMLPIRLGTVNADGPQDLLLYTLTRNGRVETTNYRTVKLPTGTEIPAYVKDEFADFYKAMFAHQVHEGEHAQRLSRVRVGHGLVRSLRRRSALARGAPRARCVLDERGTRRPSGARSRLRTSSSPVSTSATTASTFPKTSSSRRPPTAKTSRDATCSGILSKATSGARRARPTRASSPSGASAKPRASRRSPGGTSMKFGRRSGSRVPLKSPLAGGSASGGSDARPRSAPEAHPGRPPGWAIIFRCHRTFCSRFPSWM